MSPLPQNDLLRSGRESYTKQHVCSLHVENQSSTFELSGTSDKTKVSKSLCNISSLQLFI